MMNTKEDKYAKAIASALVSLTDWPREYCIQEADNFAFDSVQDEWFPEPKIAAQWIYDEFRKWKAGAADSLEANNEIRKNLINIQIREKVTTLFAIESGSRAWGFPSPDSDYDVRFVYVRPRDWYLSIEPGRDVIELPIEGDMDINGWDLKKALGLLLKPNPVLLEWLSSPVKYIWNEWACDDLLALAKKVTHGHACLHHYLSLGSRQKRVYLDGRETVNLKKYFYVVRPAMVIRWLRMNPTEIPPMNFFDLKHGIDLGADVTEHLDELLRKKGDSKELGEAPSIKVVDDFISAEFDWAEQAVKVLPKREQKDLKAEADELFRKWVK